MELECTPVSSYRPVILEGISGITESLSCLGNLICVIVLTNKVSLKTSTNFILLAMSSSDLVYTIFCMQFSAYSILNSFCKARAYTDWYYPLIFPYSFVITNLAQLCTTYFTVFLSFERYMAVCKPFEARAMSSWNRSGKACLLILILATIYCCPAWWAYESKPAYAENDTTTVLGYFIDVRLFYNEFYMFYYVNLGTLFVFRLIPLTLLIVFSVFIMMGIKEMNKHRARLTQTEQQTISVTKILFCVVLVFILSNTFMTTKLMLDSFRVKLSKPYGFILGILANYSLVIQPFSNFIIYSVLSPNFRKTLMSIVRARYQSAERVDEN